MIWPKLGWGLKNHEIHPKLIGAPGPEEGSNSEPTSYWWMFLAVLVVISYISLLNLYAEILEEKLKMSTLSCVNICSHAVGSTITLNLHGGVFVRHKPPEVFTTLRLKVWSHWKIEVSSLICIFDVFCKSSPKRSHKWCWKMIAVKIPNFERLLEMVGTKYCPLMVFFSWVMNPMGSQKTVTKNPTPKKNEPHKSQVGTACPVRDRPRPMQVRGSIWEDCTPWKINGWNIIIGVWFRSFSFLNRWFVGSMLIFQGVGFQWVFWMAEITWNHRVNLHGCRLGILWIPRHPKIQKTCPTHLKGVQRPELTKARIR